MDNYQEWDDPPINLEDTSNNNESPKEQNLCAGKNLYSERNCKSRRHGQQHTFMQHKY